MTAQVTIVLNENKDALVVPASALTRTPRGDYMVSVVDPATGKAEPRRVSVGINNNVTAEITEGLKEGDRVAATGGAFGAFRGQGAGGRQAGANGAQANRPAGGPRRFGGPLGL
jgi:macrolide-specific efflux system membrane fusion protein